MDMIKIYGTETCHWCKMARSLCIQYDLKYEYIILATDELRREFKEKFPNITSVPQITWNDRYIGGYDDFAAEVENTREFGQGGF